MATRTAPAPTPVTTSTSTPSLLSAIRSSILQLRTLRSTWVYLILLTGALYGPVVLEVLLNASDDRSVAWGTLTIGYGIFQLILLIQAAGNTAGNIQSGMAAHAFATQRRRWHWVAGQAIVMSIWGVLSYLLGLGLAIAVVQLYPDAYLSLVGVRPLLAQLFGAASYPVIAVGLAALVRNRVAAIGICVVWIAVIESLIANAARNFPFFATVRKFCPGTQLMALVNGRQMDGSATNNLASIAVVVGWAIVFMAAGLIANQRKDVV
ncbi:hypothetical protein [Corynebacterium heidelbergense]|uniref:Uncharacterized protein n=1 Tax=Corynebacterium heidelbergense TaxID=2055947 RepID=A0A364V573_9CORY|nr:hypothetical protein [Corynebacterium heidelbergense]RAV31795.1 hypothetical protein DLJ54_06475 [Corynebacterium heidelbergense]